MRTHVTTPPRGSSAGVHAAQVAVPRWGCCHALGRGRARVGLEFGVTGIQGLGGAVHVQGVAKTGVKACRGQTTAPHSQRDPQGATCMCCSQPSPCSRMSACRHLRACGCKYRRCDCFRGRQGEGAQVRLQRHGCLRVRPPVPRNIHPAQPP